MSDSLYAFLLHRFRWCRSRSPEGYRCKLRHGHGGLHVPLMGDGWAWGGE